MLRLPMKQYLQPDKSLLQEKLLRYFQAAVADLPAGVTSLDVKQFSHGQSNPTYLVQVCC